MVAFNTVVNYENDQVAYVHGVEVLDSLQGDTIVIYFFPPYRHENGIDPYSYANPRIDAHLEGDTLYIDYIIEDAHVIILPVWGIAKQFDAFKGKGLLRENLFGYISSGGRDANIYITVE